MLADDAFGVPGLQRRFAHRAVFCHEHRNESVPQHIVCEPELDEDPSPGVHRIGRDDRILLYRSEEHTSELQSSQYLVCRLLLEKKKKTTQTTKTTELTQTPHRQPTVAVTHKVSDF